MEPEFIFVATADPDFEAAALEAILDTGHGMQRVESIQAACDHLVLGTGEIALAIMDLDLNRRGGLLWHALGGHHPDFPIFVVGSTEREFRRDEALCDLAARVFAKPVKSSELKLQIEATRKRFKTHAPALAAG